MEKVETRLEALERAVTELRAQLEHERTRIRTMRMTHRCPSCGGKRILRFRHVDELDDNELKPLSLQRTWTFFGGWKGDPLEMFACRACGFIEWQAPPLDNLKADGKNVIELVYDEAAVGEQAPYR